MANRLICPTVTEHDAEIAKILNEWFVVPQWNAARVANFRGIMLENDVIPAFSNDENVDIRDSYGQVADQIVSFYQDDKYWKDRQKFEFKKANAFFDKNQKKSFSEAYMQAKEVFDNNTLNRRVQTIAMKFSELLDHQFQKVQGLDKNDSYDREDVCRGVIINDTVYGGQSNLFTKLYTDFLELYEANKEWLEWYREQKAENPENTQYDSEYLQVMHELTEYQKILENWAVICTLARVQLRITEKLKLGNTIEYIEEANILNDTDFINEFDAETAVRDAFNQQKDKLSAFGSLSPIVRRILSKLPQITENNHILEDDLGMPVYLDPIETHQRLYTILRGYYREADILKALEQEQHMGKPWLKAIIEEFKTNKDFRTAFTINMHKGMQLYSVLFHQAGELKTKILNLVASFTKTNYRVSIYTGVINVNLKNKDVWEGIEKIIKNYETEEGGTTKNPNLVTKINDLIAFYRLLDSPISFEDAQIIASGSQFIQWRKNLVNNFSYAKKYYNSEINKQPDSSLYNILKTKTDDYKNKNYNNQLDEFLGRAYKIAQSVSSYKLERRISFKDSKGKTASYDSLVESSFMTDIFDTIYAFVINKDTEGLKRFLREKYFRSSYFYIGDRTKLKDIDTSKILNSWLRELYEDADKGFEEDGFATNFIFERFLGDSSNNQEFENFTSKQHILANIHLWNRNAEISNKTLRSLGTIYGYYPVFILGDSGIAKFVQGKLYNTQSALKDENSDSIIGERNKDLILEEFYNIFQSECKRAAIMKAFKQKAKKENFYIKKSFADKDTFKFSILTFLNDFENEKISSILKWDKKTFKTNMEKYLNTQVEEYKKKLEEFGILETRKNATGKNTIPSLGILEEDLNAFLTNYYWNNKLQMANQIQFFSIDPIFYENTKDVQKRYKQIHASGIPLNLDALDVEESTTENCIYFEDISISSEFYKDFEDAIAYNFGVEDLIEHGLPLEDYSKEERIHVGKQTLKFSKYKSNTLTDGQGYRTLDSYRKVSRMAGTWTKKHEKVYKQIKALSEQIKNGKELTATDIENISKEAVIFQPIKPFVYTHETVSLNNGEAMLIPVQHKYSEVVLIPEIMPDSMLKEIALYMQEKDIDMLASTKVVKVGCFGQTNIQYETDNEGNVLSHEGKKQTITTKEGIRAALDKGYVHGISYKDYRIQTNVPVHFNEEALFGTQIRKLIMTQLKRSPNVYYDHYINGQTVKLYADKDKQRLTGINVQTFYNALIISNILESFEIFAEQTSDTKKLSELFIQNVISNGREAIDNIFAYTLTGDDSFIIPLFEGALEHDAAATLFSMFKKAVNKQKIKGGSAVQMSALGLTGMEVDGSLYEIVDPEDDSNILYTEVEMPFNPSYTDATGKEVYLKFDDYCNADGTLILEEEALDMTKYENKLFLSYYKEDAQGNRTYHKPKIETDYPGILSVIAYRIPTERAYSMMMMRVKRFSPIISGGTIKVPVQGTTIAGFDFDIKLIGVIKLC